MKFESTPEHVGSGKPLESATEAVRRIAERLGEVEEAAQEARRAGNFKKADALKQQQDALIEERQKILRKVAEHREYPLAG